MSFLDDKELNEYRNIMKPPEAGGFEDGFNWKTIAGAIFLGFIMMPASEYLSLFLGSDASISEAARWVTIILFAEISRRSFKDLKMQELYTLHFMTGLAMSSPFEGYLWKQYFVQSEFANAMGIAQELPSWAFPSAESIRQNGPTFFTVEWMPVLALTMFGLVMSRVNGYGLGYILYRLVNDVEKLPFPFAPVGAAGIVALSNSRDESETWRWRCFAIGGMIGLAWGGLYLALPSISGAAFGKRIELIPLIFLDYTPQLSKYLPAVPINIVVDLATFMSGMMVPFWSVMGAFIGVVFTMILNPFLYKAGILHNWKPGMGFVDTSFFNTVDFYLSFNMGLALAISFTSFGVMIMHLFSTKKEKKKEVAVLKLGENWWDKLKAGWKIFVTDNKERGDFALWIAALIYAGTSACWILLGIFLVEGYPWMVFTVYALVYTPFISYATAKLEGICGRAVDIPYVKELTIVLTGQKGLGIWFVPLPIQNMGVQTVGFRTLELCGTKIKSQVKTLFVVIPIVVVSSLVTSQLLWQMAPIPSDKYPYTEKMWELNAKNQCLIYSSTMEGDSLFLESLDSSFILWGLGAGSTVFVILTAMGMPVMLIYGAVWGLAQSSPGAILWQMCGAFVGRFYFKRKFKDMWLKYMSIILAGFGCGMGLFAMVSMAFVVLTNMLSPKIF